MLSADEQEATGHGSILALRLFDSASVRQRAIPTYIEPRVPNDTISSVLRDLRSAYILSENTMCNLPEEALINEKLELYADASCIHAKFYQD